MAMNLFLIGLIFLLFVLCVSLGFQSILMQIKRIEIADKNAKETVKKNEAQRSFLATVIHDLKTPIVAQLRSIHLVLNGKLGSVNTEQRELLKITEDSCKYTLNLITTILDSYKVDCQKLSLQKEVFDMKDLINSSLDEINMLAEEKLQNFILNIPSDDNKIYADYLQIKRVILNLLSNSITYGFKECPIIVNYQKNKNSVEFFVNNKSNKISDEDLSNMFDKFAQTELSKYNAMGSRLGMYLSKQIINLHGGKIYAKCTKDGSCTFGFTLPIENYSILKDKEKTAS